MNTRTLGSVWIVLAAALVLTLTPGCGAHADNPDAAAAGEDGARPATDDSASGGAPADAGEKDGETEEAVPVELVSLERGGIEAVLRYSTNLEAEDHVEVHAQAARLVTAIHVEEGDLVRKGDVLARLQDDEQRSELAKVEAELVKASREYDRQKRLYGENLISEQEFNDATYNIEQLRLRRADAQRELSYTEVRAPISGTVTQRLIRLGDQIEVGQRLFDVVDFRSIVARVYVPEKYLRELARGIEARIQAPSLGDRAYRGQVERVSPVVDPKTGTVKVTVAVGAQDGLRPGLYVDVNLVTATHDDVLLVPKRALVYDDDQMYVFRIDAENRAERVRIEPRLTDKNHVEPEGGLADGDRIVVAGQAGLKPGTLLEPQGEDTPEDNAGPSADAIADADETAKSRSAA